MAALGFDLQGHRGARGLWPENTLAGIHSAILLGVSSVELDVVLTADSIPVVYHDLRLHPDLVRDASGAWLKRKSRPLAKIQAAELAHYDVGRLRPGSPLAARFPEQSPIDGARIPLLREVLIACANTDVRLDIELKTDDMRPSGALALVEAVLSVIQEARNKTPLSIRSFDWLALSAVRRLCPLMPLAWLSLQHPRCNARTVFDAVMRDGSPAWRPVWAPDHRALRERDVAEAHSDGLLVKPWTVNDRNRVNELRAWGIDGICTDRPDMLHPAGQGYNGPQSRLPA